MIEIRDLIEDALSLTNNKLNFKHSKGCLLYGNSGTGKTLLANALANSTIGVFTISICAADLYAKYAGNYEDALKNHFQEALEQAPSIIILDEVDILCPSRSNRLTDVEKRIVSNILSFFDELNAKDAKIFILGTTNKIDNIDGAFRRCGRFDREIEIPTPNPTSR